MTTGSGRTLVAGVGNIFFGDDGFGVEVAKRLAERELPDGVTVADYGISGMHLAYDLCDGYDRAILIDATPRGGTPGTVYVLEPELPAEADSRAVRRARDAARRGARHARHARGKDRADAHRRLRAREPRTRGSG